MNASEPLREKFDSFVFEKMSETKLPSVTASVVKPGEVIHARAFGLKDIEAGLPASVRTNYGIGSVTKSFTALAICKLVEEGKLDFHDQVTKFFPQLKALEGVELHHLLSHSSGLPALGWAEVMIGSALRRIKNSLTIGSVDDMADYLDKAHDWRDGAPGSKFYYLNEGYYILGELVGKASGKSYYEFLKEKILEPLGMKRTFDAQKDVEDDGDYATPYFLDENEGATQTRSRNCWASGGAGGIFSNALDLANYVSMFIGRGEFSGRRIIGEDMIEKMEVSYIREPAGLFSDESYGYGLSVTHSFFGEKLVGHGGSTAVYTAGIAYVPSRQIGISILANSSGYPLALLRLYALALLLGKDPELDIVPIRRENLLKKLEGIYGTYKDSITASVKRNGDYLIVKGEDIGSNILVPSEDFGESDALATFFTLQLGVKMTVEFKIASNDIEMVFERYKYRKMGRVI